MIEKISKRKAIKELVQLDVDNADDETLAEVFENGAPGYKNFSDSELKEAYCEYIEPVDPEQFTF